MARELGENCVCKLPTILLDLRASIKDDIGLSSAEMMYGAPIKVPEEVFE